MLLHMVLRTCLKLSVLGLWRKPSSWIPSRFASRTTHLQDSCPGLDEEVVGVEVRGLLRQSPETQHLQPQTIDLALASGRFPFQAVGTRNTTSLRTEL